MIFLLFCLISMLMSVCDNSFLCGVPQKVETKLLGTRNTVEKKSSVEKERVKTVDGKEASFWVLLEGALADVLSPAENATFIGKMKKVSLPIINNAEICKYFINSIF